MTTTVFIPNISLHVAIEKGKVTRSQHDKRVDRTGGLQSGRAAVTYFPYFQPAESLPGNSLDVPKDTFKKAVKT